MKELKNLLPETATVLKKLSKLSFVEDFTFVGGSALALYLNHRYSEDIDLFTYQKSIDINKINNALGTGKWNNINTLNITDIQADFIIDGVKVSFFANNWDKLKKERQRLSDFLYIANIETLAAMKVNTLFMRAKFRDYYDLFVLNKTRFSLQDLYNFANQMMLNLNLNLFQRALIFTDDIEDESIVNLKPKYQVDLKQIEKHFTKQIKEMNKRK